jgi:hypothetical protein
MFRVLVIEMQPSLKAEPTRDAMQSEWGIAAHVHWSCQHAAFASANLAHSGSRHEQQQCQPLRGNDPHVKPKLTSM